MVVTKLETRKRPMLRKKWLWSVAVILLVVILLCTGVSGYVGWSMTHPGREALDDAPDRHGLAFESIEFPSRSDGLKLKGWYLPAGAETGKPTLVVAHGYTKNRLQSDVPLLKLAENLVKAGYPIVMFDFRNSGESEGTLTSVGQFEERDLLGAVDWVKAQHPGRVGLIGFSMGATTALLAAADEPDVAFVVADSPFAQLDRYLKDNLPVWSHLPAWPFTPLIMTLIPAVTGANPSKVDALVAVDRIYPRPVLFIHSTGDTAIPYVNSEQMWTKHQDKFEFWKSEKAGHVGTFQQNPEEYERRLIEFLGKQ